MQSNDMKKILLVNKSFDLGGIQSSMINMANELSKYYEVHLFVYNPSGVMKERVSANVKILEPSWRFRCLGMSFEEAIRTKNAKFIAFRMFATMWTKLFSNQYPVECAIRKQPLLTGYALAISYHHEQKKKSVVSGFCRMVDKCVQASKKLAWIHYDINTVDLDSAYNNQFYQKMDGIVCVSRSLGHSFAQKNKLLETKIDYCYNFMLYDLVRKKSELQQAVLYPKDKFVCFSACRLSAVKGIVRAVNAFADVFKHHPDVVWYIAGDGPEREKIQKAIRENGLEERILLLGNQSNPYPYIKNADLVLNVSYHEAAPMVFFESKALGTPLFATRTSSAEELLNDREDAFICDNSSEGIRDGFAWLMENKDMVQRARNNLLHFAASNEESLLKIREYMND